MSNLFKNIINYLKVRGDYHHSDPAQPQRRPAHDQSDTSRSGAFVRSTYDDHMINIDELVPGKWAILGRVTWRGSIKEYKNNRGPGKIFKFTIADKTGQVTVTAFNAVCERIEPLIKLNKVYILSRARIKNADKRYTTADVEITMDQDSLVEEVTDSSSVSDVPLAMKFNFVSIASLNDLAPNQSVDLIGAIVSIGEAITIFSNRKNRELKKKDVVIVDMSRHTIRLTIWDETLSASPGDVFVTKAARIGTYGGRSGSAGDCIFINHPEIPEVRKLKNWYSNLIDQNFTNLTRSQDSPIGGNNWRCLSQLNDLQFMKNLASAGNRALFSRCKVMLMSVGRNSPIYKCCLTESCGKKLVDTQSGDMECQKCGQTFSHAKFRYRTDVEIEDQSSSSWATLWDDKAEAMFGMKPDELERHMKNDNKEVYERIITKPNFTNYNVVLRSSIDTYNNEERVRHTVQSLMPLDPVAYTKQLINEIKALAN